MIDYRFLRRSIAVLVSLVISVPLLGQQKDADKKAAQAPNDAEMAMMMEMAKPGENHKLLAKGVGTWNYTLKFWMDPDPKSPPNESTGTAVTREVMGGRYFISEHSGMVEMPGPDGKPAKSEFKGMAVEGYDNVKKKFFSTWIDNMSTSVMVSEGVYDPASKTFTYHAEVEMMPGAKTKIREVIKIIDNDNHVFEFFEDRGGKEVRTMEIKYTRKKN